MPTKSLLSACVMLVPLFSQNSGSFLPGAIYAVHSATRSTAQTAETGLTPGSLVDVNTTGLYAPSGQLSRDESLTLRFRAPGSVNAIDMTIVATQQSFFGYPTQFTALIPTGTPLGQAEILAVAASGTIFSATLWIADNGYGLFTKAGAGYDAAIAQVYRDLPRTVGMTTPIRAGEWVALWGTGLGSAGSKVVVQIGGISVTPAYAGPAPGLPGVDQINFLVPPGLADDCYIPLTVNVGSRTSNTTSISVAGIGEACQHRMGLTSDALAILDKGGQIPLSQSWVHNDVMPDPATPAVYRRYDAVSLDFIQHDAAGVQVVTGLLNAKSAGCQLNIAGGVSAIFINAPPFDVGTPVVTGPGGVRIAMDGNFGHFSTMPTDKTYSLSSLPPATYTAGDWAVETAGGKNVAAFRAELRIPPAMRWTNRAIVSPVSRTNDLTLTWDPAGYTDREWMQGSIGVGPEYVSCRAPATAGTITIPASLMTQLSVSSRFQPTAQLLLTPMSDRPSLYSVPLVGGGSIPGIATFSYLETVAVEIQ